LNESAIFLHLAISFLIYSSFSLEKNFGFSENIVCPSQEVQFKSLTKTAKVILIF
jgi:hypothetical protein